MGVISYEQAANEESMKKFNRPLPVSTFSAWTKQYLGLNKNEFLREFSEEVSDACDRMLAHDMEHDESHYEHLKVCHTSLVYHPTHRLSQCAAHLHLQCPPTDVGRSLAKHSG
jgi:hypothetical protein